MINQLESFRPQTNSSCECSGSSKILILEQPTPSVRFRYKSEGIYPIQGITSTSTKKTFPTIQIVNFDRLAIVVISCVTKDQPYRPHPHCLAGEDCKWGIYQKQVHSNVISFEKLGIQFTKRKEIEKVMQIREKKNIDPFQTGFSHCKQLDLDEIDLDWIRLCFQVFIPANKNPENNEKKWKSLDVVVSEPIYNKTATNLGIIKLSDCSASVEGGKEILMFCDKVEKDNVEIRFFEQRDNTKPTQWEAFGLFHSSDVHRGCGISFRTPPYKSLDVETPIEVSIQLRRPSDFAVGDPVQFLFLPSESLSFKQKRRKYSTNSKSYERLQLLQEIVPNTSTPPICSGSGEYYTCGKNIIAPAPDQLQTELSCSNSSGPSEECLNMLKSFSSIGQARNFTFNPFPQTSTVHDDFSEMLGMTQPSVTRSSFHYPDPNSCNKESTSTLPFRPEEQFTGLSRNWPGANEIAAQLCESSTSCTPGAPFNYVKELGAVQMTEACDDIAENAALHDIQDESTSTLPFRPEEQFTGLSRNWPGANEIVAQLCESSTSCTPGAPFNYVKELGAVQMTEACDDIAENAALHDIQDVSQNRDEYSVIDDLSGLLEDLNYG